MPNAFERELGIPQPKCCNNGACCKGASPSTPYYKLWEKAAAGDEFARGFMAIMVPYGSREEAERAVPGLVARTLKAAEKSEEFKTPDDVRFYRCRYQTDDNRCGIWEDRPQFCRDYPDTPFVVMAPGCAFEPWAAQCKDKYQAMKAEVEQLKDLKAELARLKGMSGADPAPAETSENPSLKGLDSDGLSEISIESNPYTRIDELVFSGHNQNMDHLSLVLSLTRLYVSSPLKTVHFVC